MLMLGYLQIGSALLSMRACMQRARKAEKFTHISQSSFHCETEEADISFTSLAALDNYQFLVPNL